MFPDFSETVHDALDELDDRPVSIPGGPTAEDSSALPSADASAGPLAALAAGVTRPEARAELEAAWRDVAPALDEVAVGLARRALDGAIALLESLSDDPAEDPATSVIAGYDTPELRRLDEIRHNPTLALVPGRPEDAATRRAAIERGASVLAPWATGQRPLDAETAWAWHPTLAAMQQVLRPDGSAWLARCLEVRHQAARTRASKEVLEVGHLVGTLMRAALLPTAIPPGPHAPPGGPLPAHPDLARFRLRAFADTAPTTRAAVLAADRPDLHGAAEAIARRYPAPEEADAALEAMAEMASKVEAPRGAGDDEPPTAGDPPLRKITWWRVAVFLLLVAGSVYMYLLR